MPYLNRAIAEEQLGVNAASAGKADEAAGHYQAAIQVWNFAGRSSHLRLWPLLPMLGSGWVLLRRPCSVSIMHIERAY